jgi:hypothetical protein
MDNAVYSLSLQGAYNDNAVWKTYPDTFYFSYVTEQTFRGLSGRYYPEAFMDPMLIPLASYIGRKVFTRSPIPLESFSDADWWENDGLVSTFSQFYPRTSGNHPVGGEFDDHTPASYFKMGYWYYKIEPSIDHLDICIFPQSSQIEWQKSFYRNLYKRLALLET